MLFRNLTGKPGMMVGWLVILGLFPGGLLYAQTIRGTVADAVSGAPVVSAEIVAIGGDGFEARTLSDSVGAFSIPVSGKGRYSLRVTALGYHPSDSTTVELEQWWQQVRVFVRLATAPLEIEGITVIARGFDERHRATIGGFRVRHATALRVGPSRVVSNSDPEMKSSFDVGDVLKWFQADRRGCTVLYIDGKLRPGWTDELELLEVDGLQGIEYYRRSLDAPLEFRGGGAPCLRSPSFSVLALWRKDPVGGAET